MKLMCSKIHRFFQRQQGLGRPRAPVVHPKMIVSSLINFELKQWDAQLLEQNVDQEDMPMI